MLNLQSGNECSVYTAMIFVGKFELINVSKTTYKFAKFDKQDLEKYLKKWRLAGQGWSHDDRKF